MQRKISLAFVLGIAVTLIVIAISGIAAVYSGAFNVSAAEPHTNLGTWILNTAMRQAVRARAAAVSAPAQFQR